MYSGREGALGVEKAPRRQHRSQELDNMVQWLVDHKVERKQARKFIIQCAFSSLLPAVTSRSFPTFCSCSSSLYCAHSLGLPEFVSLSFHKLPAPSPTSNNSW